MEGEKNLVHSVSIQFRAERIVRDCRGGGEKQHLFIQQVFSLEEKAFKGILGVEGEKLVRSASVMFRAERIVR